MSAMRTVGMRSWKTATGLPSQAALENTSMRYRNCGEDLVARSHFTSTCLPLDSADSDAICGMSSVGFSGCFTVNSCVLFAANGSPFNLNGINALFHDSSIAMNS